MNLQSTTVPLVNLIADISLEPPTPNGNGKHRIFDVLDGVAAGICNWGNTEARKQMMREAADLLLQGFVPGPSIASDGGKSGLWMFDSHRYRQLRPVLMDQANDRANEKLREFFEDAEPMAEVAAAHHLTIVRGEAVGS